MRQGVYIFGYGRASQSISQTLHRESFRLHFITTSEAEMMHAKGDGHLDVTLIDVTKDDELARLGVKEDDHLVCVMSDEHLNVFLTLSLRALFPDTQIIAISDSIHTTQKLQMAGATKIIDLHLMSANRIHNILQRPIATKILDDIIMKEEGISFKEMTIPSGSFLDGRVVDSIDFRDYGVLLVGIIDKELGNKFLFITNGIEHKLDCGDIIVCIGEAYDLQNFEKLIASNQERI